MKLPVLLSIKDLQIRWDMSRQAIHKRRQKSDFPVAEITVSDGTLPLFTEDKIIEYEEIHPELLSRSLREARRKWLYKTIVANR